MVSGCSGVKNLFHMEEVVGLKSDISGLKTESHSHNFIH